MRQSCEAPLLAITIPQRKRYTDGREVQKPVHATIVITREAMVDRYLPVLNAFAPALQSDCIADRSVAQNYLRLVINARRLL